MTGIFDGSTGVVALYDGFDPIIKVYDGATLIASFVPDEPPPPGPEPVQIMVLSMNQTSGTMTETVNANDGVVSGGIERGLDGITSGSSFSAAADGSGAGVTVSHIAAYQVNEFSVVINSQRDTDPAVGSKFVAASKDGFGLPGGWSIEDYNDGGTVKRRAYIRDSAGVARWIGGSTGVVAVPAETAYTGVLTYEEGVGGKLWSLSGAGVATLHATEAACDVGLTGNTAALQLFGYTGGVAGFDGIVDDVQLWQGALDEADIEALDTPVSITHAPADPLEFTCLTRETGTLLTTHKDLGEILGTAGFLNLATGGNARYDITGTIRRTDLSGITWQGKRNLFRADGNNGGAASFDGACVSGGAFLCNNMNTDHNWDQLYQSANAPTGHVLVRECSMTNMLFEGIRIHGGFDGFQNASGTRNTCSNVTLRKWAMTMMRDDAIENDNWWPGLVVDDCYVESFIFFSCRNTGFNGSSLVNTIQNCLVHDLPCRIDGVADRSPPLFKLNSNSVMFDLFDNIFAITKSSYQQAGDPFGELVTHNKIRTSEGNVICWLGSGSYPEPVPTGFSVLTGATAQDTWADALAAWWDAFPGTRFDFDPVAP